MAQSETTEPERGVKYINTIDAYDQWAEVYDTDGNFLQALDTLEMKTLLPEFLSINKFPGEKIKYVDLGCGTGRNTLPLAQQARGATIVGLDPSEKMLELAHKRTADVSNVQLERYDILGPTGPPASALEADGVISTLVVEHVPLQDFFRAVTSILKPGGALLLTNMHSEMGGVTQAGFVDPQTKMKVRGKSYAHSAEEIVAEAAKFGLELVGEMKEVTLDEKLALVLGPRASKYIGVRVWFGGCFECM
ncbi:methyltransferase small domain-containing protein [Trichophyton tonsurans CBS 112818]|uniref:Methyltransferase small domain-containing protein n=2 Tax=Trichophyton TaxID=5550 RepID=F2Q5J7_TRIEC|nr:methyltransferase small domain-containing protein [Trichophyton tonsurans CBS 112818]EGE09415.1 methyltransferase small domain-containing protein [Trichophyton equinum CBS 127.97]